LNLIIEILNPKNLDSILFINYSDEIMGVIGSLLLF